MTGSIHIHQEVKDMKEEMKKIVVLGGSFNPPTVAHLQLLRRAMDVIGARKGIFVPVSEAYLARKMRRGGAEQLRFSEQLRYDMLTAMCADDERLSVSGIEFGTICAQTRETMAELARQYPGWDLYFLVGADKLNMVAGWFRDKAHIIPFRLLVVCRDGIDVESFLRGDPRTADHLDSFVTLSLEDGIQDVSSTRVRTALRSGGSVSGLVHPAVEALLEPFGPEDFIEEITHFRREVEFISGKYPTPVEMDGVMYSCADAAYYAALCAQEKDRIRMAAAQADRLHRYIIGMPMREGWMDMRLGVMEAVTRAKFAQHPDLMERLLATGKKIIIAGNVKDPFFGYDLYSCRGENHLGKILMAIRDGGV